MQQPKLTDSELSMTEDFDWARHAPEVQQNPEHFGKLVVVHHKRILAVGRQRQTLLAQAADSAKVPPEQLVVVLVPRPGLWETPH
jgi:hypothetical protein